jgi:hypothetical protein
MSGPTRGSGKTAQEINIQYSSLQTIFRSKLVSVNLTPGQKIILWCASAIGLFGINGIFVYSLLVHPELVREAHRNLYALGFMLEAFVLLPVLCFLISIAKLKSPGWITFLVLSLLGSLAFSIPFSVLLWSRNAKKEKYNNQ